MPLCGSCGRENPPDARFCSNCGAPLAAKAEPTREERKVVTVLFADLVGFTSRAEQMDPEDVRAVLEPYHARLRSELERRGGTVEKFIGDAVMALFGAPTSHEDDPERAVRAALAIRDWIREEGDLQVRIGVTTGEALVALGARPLEGEGMASGDVVNTAARLESAAPANGVLVDETTQRSTGQAISYAEHEPVEAKGKSKPVPVWEVVEARSRYGVDVSRSGGAPLVGRQKELDLLRDALLRARQEETPQLVTLVGVPGIGKSRLVAELFAAVDATPDLVYWRQGRCLPYGEGVTYWALSEMVKAHANILETDTEQQVRDKLSSVVSEALENVSDAEWVEGHLRPLVGLAEESPSPGDRQTDAFAAWRRFFEALAERSPLVLVVEDLHWADDSLLDFVDHLVEWATGVPLLVVCTARPELLSRRADWGGGKQNATTISLSPLSAEDTARLVHALLERAVLPAELQATLIDRAGGNPLYAEEFARMVDDLDTDGETDIRLPESVQGIIAARLDAIPLEEKLVLQDAAVVGKVFWLGALELIGRLDRTQAEQLLHALERKEFIRRERRSSVGDESQFVFRHLLVRDVAYSQIPRSARAAKHQGAAEWIESLGRAEDHAEMRAHHYLTALELARASGADTTKLADQARLSLREAADRAGSLSAYPSAKKFYGAALELWPRDDEDYPQLLFRYASALNLSEHAGSELLEEARDALLAAGDPDTAAEAQVQLAESFWLHGERDFGFEQLDRAEAIVRDRPASFSKVSVVANVSRFKMLAGESEAAIRLGNEALAMIEALGGNDELRAHTLNNIGTARINSGDPGGIKDLEQSVEIASKINSHESVRAYGNLASVLTDLGQLERGAEMVEKGAAAAERFGIADHLRWLTAEALWQPYWDGRWDEASPRLDELIVEFERLRYWMETPCRWLRGRIRLGRGDDEGAHEDAARVVERARVGKDPQLVWPSLSFAARAHVSNDPERAYDLAREVLSTWEPVGQASGLAEWLGDLSIVFDKVGKSDELLEALPSAKTWTPWLEAASAFLAGEFSRAADVYEETGSLPNAAYARLRAAEALVEEGRRAEANAELERSLAFWRSAGATAYVREGEALLAESA
jgi:class 3 adenylate cyclase/tetratricopeptide (TPR) repeat protein